MQRLAFVVALVATAAAFHAEPATAQANRTFVSGQGSDANPCTLAAPCRSFAQALTQTNAGGEITILDPAGYGTVTITKAISIINDGVGEAGVTTSTATDAITISAGINDEVNLRGLTLVGGATGNNGVTITSGGTVNIQNSVIRGFLHQGINMIPTGNSKLVVLDTTVSANFGTGVYVAPSGNVTVRAVFKRVQSINNSGKGFYLYGGSIGGSGTLKGSAVDSLAVGNQSSGFEVASFQSLTTTTVFDVVNCQAIANFIGVETTSTDTAMYLAGTMISDSTNFSYSQEGTIFSFGNNIITQNPNHIGGSLTLIGQQ
jgi:hypothetical protein